MAFPFLTTHFNIFKFISVCTIVFIVSNGSAQNLGEHKFEEKNKLLLNSDFDSVQVFVNDSFVGIAPVSLENLPTGTYYIRFKYDTLVVRKYNVEYKNGTFREIFGIFEKNKALITLYSEPANAGVFINDSLIGHTPINKMPIKTGVYNLSVKLDGYTEWKRRFIANSDLYQFDPVLINNYGYVNLIQADDSQLFYINNSSTQADWQNTNPVPVGENTITVKSDKYHKSFEETFNLKPDEQLNIKFIYGTPGYLPLVYSALLPGLGQVVDNSKFKGYSIMLANLLLGGLTAYTIGDYSKKLDTYNNDVQLYEQETNEFLVLRRKGEMQSSYDEANSALTLRNVTIGALIVAYFYNLVDAYFNHSIGGDFIITSDQKVNSSNIALRVKL